MKRRSFLKKTAAAGALTLITPWGITESLAHPYTPAIADDFMTPPMSSWPQTWWHWMNGNVTKEGITLDLEAMKRVGVGGFQNFDAGTLIPKGPIVYLSPEWIELKKHTIKEAERLGLEFTMHNCPGWSSSGGPWITPELNMQQITHSELYVTGGKQVSVSLPKPFSRLNFYKDAFVFAFPSLQGERSLQTLTTSITSSNGAVDVKKLTGEDETGVKLLGETGKPVYLQFEFKEPLETRMLTLFSAVVPVPGAPAGGGGRGAGGGGGFGGGGGAPAPAGVVLEASDDGIQFRNVTNLVAGGGGGGGGFGGGGAAASVTVEFTPTKAKYFRITSIQRRKYTQVRFSNASRIPNWMAKANFNQGANNVVPPKEIAENSIINPDSVIDITKSMDQNGVLNWNAPAGEWTVVRFGHTASGTQNRSAPDTGIGLECDKYSTAAIDFHFNKMMENLLPTLAPWAGKGKVGLLIDSYEVGMQNWTPLLADDFKKRRGYDITKYLPTLTGRIVGSVDASDRFLWDMRRTCADLMADNYYGRFAELCKKNNIISYTEPYDRGPMEEMQIGARVDVNMGEFWNGLSTQFQGNYTMRRTTKLAASIQNINGRKIVGAEAFTGEAESAKWQEYPFMMKPLGDRMFAQGLNRMIFHRYAHQPHATALPGMTMG
ncbi:MAG TPA: glycosyl hydrolase, partial [Cyclobacteriaceae bacterium]|nr:glycosyl hydrolase [Cyclobacteriaceae bacterium]